MASSTTAVMYDPFGINGGGTTAVGKGTTRSNSTGGSAKSNAGVQYDPFNIEQQELSTPLSVSTPKATPAPPKPQSLLSKTTTIAKKLASGATSGEQTVAHGVARLLPGGLADVNAQEQQASTADKTVANVIAEEKAGKISKASGNSIIQAQAGNAAGASTAQAKTIKAMPTKGQLAAGFASTAADIGTAGTLPELKGASLLSKTANVASKATAYGSAGLLNAASSGESGKSLVESTVLGAALPGAAHVLGKVAAPVIAKAGDKLAETKVGQAVTGVKAAIGRDKSTNNLITNARTQALQAADKPRPINAVVNPEHVSQGLVHPEIHQTNISDISIPADNVHKLDSAKVAQYTKQMKDGEPVEPVVTHQINGQTHVVDGQNRLAAAQKLGHTTIPTVEKVPGAVPQVKSAVTPESKIGNDRSNVKDRLPTSPLTPKPDNVISITDQDGNTTHHELSGQALDEYNQAKSLYDSAIKNHAHDKSSFGDSRRKAAGMQLSAAKRQITGNLTGVEKQNILKRERSAYVGKDVTLNVNGKTVNGKIASTPAFGNVKVELEDGTTVSVKHGELPEDKRSSSEILAPYTLREGVKPYEPRTVIKPIKEPTKPESPSKAAPATISKPVTTKAVVDPNAPPETGTSKIAQDVQAKAVAKNLTQNYGEVTQYNKINVANEADKAVKFVNGDKDEVMQVIRGDKPLPANLRATAVIKAVEEHPTLGKDGDVLKALANSPLNSESSRSAQELRLAAERDKYSSTEAIKTVQKSRQAEVEKRTGTTTAKAVGKEVQAIRAAKPKVTKETFSSFVDSLKC